MTSHFTAFALAAIATTALSNAQSPLSGVWHGAIDLKVQTLSIEVHLFEREGSAGGTISIPVQGADKLPLTGVSLDPAAVAFDLPAGPGIARFRGTLDGEVLGGSFRQGFASGTFKLERGPLPSEKEEDPANLPYSLEDAEIPAGEHTLAGTLFIPEGEGPFGAVVLVSGSGPQTRVADVMGFPVFRRLADHLARAGIAVLAYDDRGVGKSGGRFDTATTLMLADDAEAAWNWLRSRKRIDPSRSGILGHSEGGLIAPIVAARNGEVPFIVMLAGPAVPGEEILRRQLRLIMKAGGSGEAAIEREAKLQALLLECAKTGSGWEEAGETLEKAIRARLETLPEDSRDAIGDLDAHAKSHAKSQVDATRGVWFRQFLTLDPRPRLAGVKVPTLAIYGGKDTQVDPEQSLPELRKAMESSGPLETAVVEQANHLFQRAVTGAPGEYGALRKDFDPDFLKVLIPWLKAR